MDDVSGAKDGAGTSTAPMAFHQQQAYLPRYLVHGILIWFAICLSVKVAEPNVEAFESDAMIFVSAAVSILAALRLFQPLWMPKHVAGPGAVVTVRVLPAMLVVFGGGLAWNLGFALFTGRGLRLSTTLIAEISLPAALSFAISACLPAILSSMGMTRSAQWFSSLLFSSGTTTAYSPNGETVLSAAFPPNTPKHRALVISDLHHRAASLLGQNTILLTLIIAVLIGAAYLIVYTGLITGNDRASTDPVQMLTRQVSEKQVTLDRLEESKKNATIEMHMLESQIKPPTNRAPTDPDGKLTAAKETLTNITAQADRAETDLKETQEFLKQATQKSIEKQATGDGNGASKLLLASAVTRFGILAIVIFLVQILIGLYRYNARIASAYLAEADALTLLDVEPEKLALLVKSLTPGVGFDKGVSTLPEKLLESISDAVKAGIDKTKQSD